MSSSPVKTPATGTRSPPPTAIARSRGTEAYPQRFRPLPTWQERLAERASRPFRQHRAGRDLARAVSAIDALEADVGRLDEAALRERLARLRPRLERKPDENALAIEAFALVRETADRELGQRHYRSQLAGGWIMHAGMLAEMETGEGKTLTATLPAATAALARIPVHVVTPNDYLAARDAAWMGPVYRALGLSVGVITEDMDAEARRHAYGCDITYCCNKQLAFDYLRDRMVLGDRPGPVQLQIERLHSATPRLDRLLLRGLHFAIVDEADSVLVDEARTPLIISSPPGDAAGQPGGQADQAVYLEALAIARGLEPGLDFHLDEASRGVRLTSGGEARLAAEANRGGVWKGRRRRLALITQALSALHLFLLDRHYLVRDDKVQIIDEYTGRVMADRSWERGLHQMIEAKEGCAGTGQRETLARISYQRFFRRYRRLAGMSGTASEVAGELGAVYGLLVRTVPTNRPVRRRLEPPRVYVSSDARWTAVLARIGACHASGQPVLIGTRSVAASVHLSALLTAAGLAHQVLNARQDADEAAIIERAGERGRITVATNMAGRGADIGLGDGVAELGGLVVVATEANEARRIDRQLYGRCARQGDPGTAALMASLDDELTRPVKPLFAALARDGLLPPVLGRLAVRIPQRWLERRHSKARAELLEQDERLGDLLAFSGAME